MGINFPNAPTTGQLYPLPAVPGVPQYRWDGEKWSQSSLQAKTVIYADGSVPMTGQLTVVAPPVNPTDAAAKSYVDSTASSAGSSAVAAAAVRYDALQALTATQQNQAQKNAGLPAIMRSYFAGLTLSTAGSSTTFSIAPGVCVDSSNADVMILSSALAKTTAAWAAGSGNGALDTGAIAASSWYAAFLIKNITTGAVDAVITKSVAGVAPSPALPSGFTLGRYLGSMKTNASSQWTAFTQLGDTFYWTNPVADVSVTPSTGSRTLYTMSVPLGVQVDLMGEASINSATAQASAYITSPDQADVTTSLDLVVPYSGQYATINFTRRTNTAGQLGLRGINTSSVGIITMAWTDRRGRDN